MRLPTKPSHTPTSTPTLPIFLDKFITVAMVSCEVLSPRTFSIRRMTLAGLKKCVPITASGRVVAAAISFTSSVEVLVARTASALQVLSRRANTSFFSAIFSNTASMTMSASPASSKLVLPVMRPRRASISAWESRPLETVEA